MATQEEIKEALELRAKVIAQRKKQQNKNKFKKELADMVIAKALELGKTDVPLKAWLEGILKNVK